MSISNLDEVVRGVVVENKSSMPVVGLVAVSKHSWIEAGNAVEHDQEEDCEQLALDAASNVVVWKRTSKLS